MDKILKIIAGFMIVLGVVSGFFLLVSKKITTNPSAQKIPTENVSQPPVKAPVDTAPSAKKPKTLIPDRTALLNSQWLKCKEGLLASNTLYWDIKLTESIPVSGTYAKGFLNSKDDRLVRIIIKPEAENSEKIKARLVVGKNAFLRGNCIGVATDGAVVFQAF